MTGFKSSGYDWRLFCGGQVLEANLASMVARAGAKRAFVICSPSIKSKTDTVSRISDALGDTFAGCYADIAKDSTYQSVAAATQAAEEAEADLLIAVGGGSVLVAVRAVAIFMCENEDPFSLMTQYPEGKPAYSPRLMAPKIPIFNIPTTPTSAMNRAGTGLKNDDLDHRMEFFDPKTRPQGLFLDYDVLLSTPTSVLRSTATTVFASTVAAIASAAANPLVAADQSQAFTLAHAAYLDLPTRSDDPLLRRDLALAAFLQNRAEDDGTRVIRGGPFSGNYGVATALHIRYPEIGQGESTCVLHATTLRMATDVDENDAQRVAKALNIGAPNADINAMKEAIAKRLEDIYERNTMPIRVGDLKIPKDDLINIAKQTVKNFNANAGARDPEDQIAAALNLLEAAW